MPYIVIAAAAILVAGFSLVATSVSFDFLPAVVRIGAPIVVALVAFIRGEGLRRVAEVLVGVLLLMVLNPAVFGSGVNEVVAIGAVAAMVITVALRIGQNEGERVDAFSVAWSGLLVVVVLFVLLAGAARTLGFVTSFERQLR